MIAVRDYSPNLTSPKIGDLPNKLKLLILNTVIMAIKGNKKVSKMKHSKRGPL
jgi:hypothetical protein